MLFRYDTGNNNADDTKDGGGTGENDSFCDNERNEEDCSIAPNCAWDADSFVRTHTHMHAHTHTRTPTHAYAYVCVLYKLYFPIYAVYMSIHMHIHHVGYNYLSMVYYRMCTVFIMLCSIN